MKSTHTFTVGSLAWWRVRDPIKTATEPQRLAVVILAQSSASRFRVEVQHVDGVARDSDRLPGERFTVTAEKLSPRELPSPNKVKQARKEARLLSSDADAAAVVSSYVGDVVGLKTTAHGLEYLRRVVRGKLADKVKALRNARRKDGQPLEDFREFYANAEAKIAFLQDLLSSIERARVV